MEIEFNLENIEKCLCIKCKVQSKSQCVKDKLILLQEKALSGAVIEPGEFPALHCASGREHCTDLDGHENCICINCTIWKENDLETGTPGRFFCMEGRSIQSNFNEASYNAEQVALMLRHYYRRTD